MDFTFANRRSRHSSISRRTVVRNLSVGLLGGLAVGSTDSGSRGRVVDASQKPTTLSIAMLDRHWANLQVPIEDYAEGREISVRVDALSLDALYGSANLVLTQQGDAYDLVFLPDQWIPQFASFLTPLSVPQEVSNDLVPSAWEVARYPADGPAVGLAWAMDVQVFGMHTDVLSRLNIPEPETWDETLAAVTELDAVDPETTGVVGFGMRTASGHEVFESFLPVLRGYGLDLLDPVTQVPRFDTAEAVAAMEMFLALARSSPAESPAVGAPTNADRFAQGEIAMMSNLWSSDLSMAASRPDDEVAADIGIRRQPAQLGVPRGVLTGIWIAAIPLGSANPDVARDLANWLIEEATQRSMTGYHLLPVRQSAFPATAPGTNSAAAYWNELATAATPRLRSPYYAQLEQLVTSELGKALEGVVSAADAMKQANLAVRAFLVREGVLDG